MSVTLALAAGTATAELRLPAVISDGMVLQRDRTNPIWGWADPGDRVVVEVAGRRITCSAEPNGKWVTNLPKMPASAAPRDIRVSTSSGSKQTLRNVLVGEVWLCTGPSNIYWPVGRCDDAKQEIAAADYPQIRFFTVQRNAIDEPQADCKGDWFACSPATVSPVSGIGYFFARRIHKENGVPVGVLQSYWGGSRVEAWTSRKALEAEPELKPILDWWRDEIAQYDPDMVETDYQQQLRRWQSSVTRAKEQGKPTPRRPSRPVAPNDSPHRPSCLYNGMIAPLAPFGIRGVICYQGLGNLYWAQHSRCLLSTMIRDWRARWGETALPLGMVQPAPYPCDRWPKQREDAYSLQREAQILMLDELANTGIAPTMDIGDLKVLHFTNKQDVGRRLAQWALTTVYGKDAPFAGPIYQSMTIENDSIRVHFAHAGEGLTTSDGQPPSHFEIAGKDKIFRAAKAIIDGNSVVVRSDHVAKPVAVRFAWSDTAVPNLCNRHGLPASLFRSNTSDESHE